MFKKGIIIRANVRPRLSFNFDYRLILYFTLFLCGVITGVLLIKNAGDDFNSFFSDLIVNNINAKKSNSLFTDFCFTFLCVFVVFFINYLCSLSAVGFPFIWLILALFGCFCGAVTGELVLSYGFKGLLYCLIVQIPCYAITAATLVCCCCESTKICNNIFFYLFGNCGCDTAKAQCLKDYTLKYLIMCLPILVGVLLEAICFRMFSGFFVFG